MKGLNLEGFKKVAEDEKSTTLKHPKGHMIKIAKGALSKPMRSELDKLPLHRADGGDIPSVDNALSAMGVDESKDVRTPNVPDYSRAGDAYSRWNDITTNLPASPNFYDDSGKFNAGADAQAMSNLGGSPLNTGVDDDGPPASSISASSNPSSNPFDQVQGSQVPGAGPGQGLPGLGAGFPGMPFGLPSGVQQQISGINQMAGAQAQAAKAQAQAAAEQQKALADLQAKYATNLANAQKDIDDTMKDINEKSVIKPDHYLESMGTGQKIGTAIGLVLGGLGAGMTHGQNPALAFLNSQIDRDIESQKAAIGKRDTLLSANFKRFGNMQDAMLMTKAMQHEIYATKVAQAAAQAGTAQAMGNAKILIGQLKGPYEQSLQQFAQRQTLVDAVHNGVIPPEQAVPLLVPKDQQSKVFDEMDKAKNAVRLEGEIMQRFDSAAKDNTVARTGAGLMRTPESILGLRAATIPIIHVNDGRVNEFEQKTVEGLFPKPGDTDAKIAAKREDLQRFIRQQQSGSVALGHGIDFSRIPSMSPNPLMRLPPQAQQYVQWARQNPQDKRSAIILNKLGVK